MTYAEFIESLLLELERQRQYYHKLQKEVASDIEISESLYRKMVIGSRRPGSEVIDRILTYTNLNMKIINNKQGEKYYHALSYPNDDAVRYGIRYGIDPVSVVRIENNQELHHDISFRDKKFENLDALIRHTEAMMCDLPYHFGEINPLSIIPQGYLQYRFEITEGKKMETYLFMKEEVIFRVCKKINLPIENIGKLIYAAGCYFLVDKMRLDIYYPENIGLQLMEDIKSSIRELLNNAPKQFTGAQII